MGVSNNPSSCNAILLVWLAILSYLALAYVGADIAIRVTRRYRNTFDLQGRLFYLILVIFYHLVHAMCFVCCSLALQYFRRNCAYILTTELLFYFCSLAYFLAWKPLVVE